MASAEEMLGSASRGTIEDRRPENFKLGSDMVSECAMLFFASGLSVEGFIEGGSICPGRTALFVSVLGVANREIWNVLAFGVTPNVEVLPVLVGDPFSVTFVGDCGRLAGDWRSEALNGEPASVDRCAGTENLNGERSMESPRAGF